eukprot:2897485-Rhodomonas_salina.3
MASRCSTSKSSSTRSSSCAPHPISSESSDRTVLILTLQPTCSSLSSDQPSQTPDTVPMFKHTQPDSAPRSFGNALGLGLRIRQKP